MEELNIKYLENCLKIESNKETIKNLKKENETILEKIKELKTQCQLEI